MKKIDKRNIEDILPLTPMQEGMLFHYLKDPHSDLYFEQLSLKLSGVVDIDTFKQAWDIVIKTNEMLRTVYRWETVDKPVQIILKEYKSDPVFFDRPLSVQEVKTNDRNRAFDLNDVPFRVTLCRLDQNEYELIVSNHHILYDGWSNGIILEEFQDAYDALCKREPLTPPVKRKTKFKEFVKWMQHQDPEDRQIYWETYLKGFEKKTLRCANENGVIEKKRNPDEREIFRFPIAETAAAMVKDFIEKQKVTLASFLYSAWGILLQRYTGSNDVVFGTTVSLRNPRVNGIEHMVGPFINTLPLRIKTGTRDTAVRLLKDVGLSLQTREKYENTSLADIKSISGIDRQEDLFDSIVVIENYPISSRLQQNNRSLTVEFHSMIDTTHFDLTVDIVTAEELDICFTYKPVLFSDGFIENMGNHLGNIMKEIVGTGRDGFDKRIGDIDILNDDERKQILYEFNDNRADFSKDKTVYQLMERHAQVFPDRIAVIFGENEQTYGSLNETAGELAEELRNSGIERDRLVGILLDRSHLMVESILATWKAGGAYLPIDPQYPLQRITGILNDSCAALLITQPGYAVPELPTSYHGRIITLDGAGPGNTNRDTDADADTGNVHAQRQHMNSLAYVIYTSGSTGKPKGVMVEHTGMMNHIQAKINDLGLTGKSIIAQNASQCFDISVWQFFAALTVGGQTVIYPNQLILDPEQLVSRLKKDRVTILEVVPSYLSVLLAEVEVEIGGTLDCLLVTGEEIKANLVEKWFEMYPGIKMVNAYGPTEASDDITHHIMDRAPGTTRIPIGKPLQNFNIYIVDDNMNLCPVGIKGEIVVSGIGVGRGYLGDEERTRNVFTEDPFVKEPGVRLYKTGELGCWLPDGTIDFFGRKDYQVKIKGFRIELGEIENRLLNYPGIKEAVVTVAVKETSGEKYLCAYFVGKGTVESTLKEHLSHTLPHYMIPSYFVQMEKMPLTANGKIDRKALPEPGLPGEERTGTVPRDKTEKTLAGIWSDILTAPKETIRIDDDFFERGGHSLKVTVLASRIHKAFNIKIPLAEIFRLSTIRGLSYHIKEAGETEFLFINAVEEGEYYPLSLTQRRLFILNEIGAVGAAYNLPAVWQVEGRLDIHRFKKAFRELIQRHESLRTSFEYRKGESAQIIHDYNNVDFQVDYMEMAGELGQIIDSFIQPFDLGKAPLLRVGLIRLAKDKHILLYDMHHIISDGVTIVVLTRDFIRLYDGKELGDLRIQYKDFSAWQIRQIRSEEMKRQETYWLDRFKDGVPTLLLETDNPRPSMQSFEGASISFELNEELTANIRQVVSQTGTTLYIVLLAAYNILLSKYTGQEDIVVGLPIAGRNHADLEDIIGFFVNTLVIRNRPEGDKSVGRFLEEVKITALGAYGNQNYPCEQLVNRLKIPKDLSRNPLFDAMFVLQNMDPLEEFENLTITPYEFERKISHFDLHLQAFEADDTIDMALEYSSALFKPSTVKTMTKHYIEVLEQVAENRRPGELRLKEIGISHELAAAKPKRLREELGGFDF